METLRIDPIFFLLYSVVYSSTTGVATLYSFGSLQYTCMETLAILPPSSLIKSVISEEGVFRSIRNQSDRKAAWKRSHRTSINIPKNFVCGAVHRGPKIFGTPLLKSIAFQCVLKSKLILER